MADLMTELLKADASIADKKETATYLSKNLGKILGKDAVEIELREISPKEFQNINDYATNKDGSRNPARDMEATGMLCVKGVVNPDLTSGDLQERFGVDSGRDLAWKLFKMETANIANEILRLSGILTEDDEDEMLKNL